MSDDNTQDWPDSSQPDETTPPPPAPPPPAPDPDRPPIPAAAGTSGSPGSLGQRFLARLIDHILLGVVMAIISSAIIIPIAFSSSDASAFSFAASGAAGIVINIIGAAIAIGYFAWMDSTRGQTLGKMALKLRVVGPDGGNPSFQQAAMRNAWLALPIIPILGGLVELGIVIWIAVTINSAPDGRGPHDGWAGGTQVVVA
ncbi:MAG: RDD family protein [Nitriliruptorales bacterium]|nr:RDD family protein [Nitriliruptorales bacterium]